MMGIESLLQNTTDDQNASAAGPGFNIPSDVVSELGGPPGLVNLIRLMRMTMDQGPPPPLPENMDFSKGMPKGLIPVLNTSATYGKIT